MKNIFIALFLVLSLSCMENKKLLVIGHRGAMGHETENTIASIEKALALEVNMIEIDVFKIASGEIVVFHDDSVERLTNGKGNIEAFTLSELRKLEVVGGHQIPLFTEVLNIINKKVPLNIELKGANTAKDVDEIIKTYISEKGWELNDFIISSFNWDELILMREVNNDIAVAVLIEDENPLEAIPLAKKLHAVAINPDADKLTLEIANKIREAGFKIYPWTVNDPQKIIEMKRIGVDGMFTNYPERVK
ncbi:glycerophosphodiester phosphodiesterase [Cellulophaga baltica]|uniref:glycerophosphodiester phosphodiesterase n=1 Tax=Cellulophaga TaxID=104264 RepID=UPI001C06B2CD|nr:MULTISPECIES: glycerophosphodiester phosphodiesterase family protein [Cellulophaga]MBU2995515.1 glycerophosphodiester phosphodiesterase [Cellulophaga baltica]MDO6766909.1 glycerophosphodiester phosphodiesterase family protein [Cellulophaga sp. 1_MG-2023]